MKRSEDRLFFMLLSCSYFVCGIGTTIWTLQDLESDYSKQFLYGNAEAKKISFPLAGMRLKRQDLWVRGVASLAAFLIGLLRNIVSGSV